MEFRLAVMNMPVAMNTVIVNCIYRITFGEYGLPCGLRNVNDLTSSNISLGGNSSNLFCI